MTGQDWIIIAAAWCALAVIVAGVMLEQQTHARRLHRHRTDLANHHRRLLRIEATAADPATSTAQPMPTIGHQPHKRAVKPRDPQSGMTTADHHQKQQEGANQPSWQATNGDTHRLQRPPALTDIEGALTTTRRALTATELATILGRQPWDLIADIDRDLADGRITTVPGHTAGRTAYQLADTHRMPHGMPLLPGGNR